MDVKIQRIAAERAAEFRNRSYRIRVRSMFKKFGYKTRTDAIAHNITMALRQNGIVLFPPIDKIGGVYKTGFDDFVDVKSTT